MRSSENLSALVTYSLVAEHCVYLSFDDGPDPQWTPRILDILAAAGAPAIFFVIGRAARAHPGLLRRVADAGHRIGNHTYRHKHPWMLSEAAARAEVRDGAAAVADALGRPPVLFRPPHGRLRACMLEAASELGQSTLLWNLSAVDWGPLATSRRIAARLQHARAGDIVLMHDGANRHNRPWELAAALPAVLENYANRRLQIGALA